MRLTTLAVATVTFSTLVSAQSERDLGSHEHGHATLNVAIDDGLLFLELESPWNNLVGFEHAPRTTEQHELVDGAMDQLNQPEQLFVFNGAECVSTGVNLESGMSDAHDDHDDDHDKEHDDHDADHDKDHDDHDKEHDDHDDHDKDHDDHAHGGDEETHSSLLVAYSFDCSDMAQLKAIDVKFLEMWSGFEELDVQVIGPGGQTAVELGPDQMRVDVTAVQ